MKIAYTISGLYNSGGMENILTKKMNYLAEHAGYDITVITTDQKNRPVFFDLSPKIRHIDLGLNYCDKKGRMLWHLHKCIIKYHHFKKLKNFLNQEKFDYVVSLMDFDFSFLYKIKDQSKKIIEYHFAKYSKLYNTNNIILKKLFKIKIQSRYSIIRKYHKFVVLTHEDAEQWSPLNNIVVIPNFITVKAPDLTNLSNKEVISVGRFSYQKGFDLLIKAWRIVADTIPEWNLKIIGGGSHKDIEKLVSEFNLSNRVVLKEATNDIGTEYKSSSLYIMSSRFEGLPLVLLEAMSYGLPIISFQCPCGPRDIVKPDFGELIPNGDIEGLAYAIVSWLRDKERLIKASNNACIASKKFEIDTVMGLWINLFENS